MTLTMPGTDQDATSALTIVVRLDRASTVVVLRGDVDVYAQLALTDALSRLISTRTGDVVIDLTEVRFLDRAGARVFEIARELLNGQARSLTVRSPSTTAAQVLGGLGLSGMIETGVVSRISDTHVSGGVGTT